MKERDLNRRDRRMDMLIRERRHDPYKSGGKLAEPSVCSDCGAVFMNARWVWTDLRPEGAQVVVCPACQRIADNYPAGEILLSGSYLQAHEDEIEHLMRNAEAQEKQSHPLERIMALEASADGLKVTTTGIHLPRQIGHALEHAHKGKLETHYDEAGYFVTIKWSRSVDY